MRRLLRQYRLPRHFYLLMAIALISLIEASIGIANGISRILAAGQQVELGYRRIAATHAIMAIARDEETGQRGFVLTGQERFLNPFMTARPQAAGAWANLEQLASSRRKGSSKRAKARRKWSNCAASQTHSSRGTGWRSRNSSRRQTQPISGLWSKR